MINILVGDLDKEMTEARVEDENAQEEYEQLLKDSMSKRVEDSKALTDKESNRAGLDATLEISQAARKSTSHDLELTKQYLASVHQDCDWLLENYDARKSARADEA